MCVSVGVCKTWMFSVKLNVFICASMSKVKREDSFVLIYLCMWAYTLVSLYVSIFVQSPNCLYTSGSHGVNLACWCAFSVDLSVSLLWTKKKIAIYTFVLNKSGSKWDILSLLESKCADVGGNPTRDLIVYWPTTRLGCQNRKCTYVNNRCIRSRNIRIITLTLDGLNECNCGAHKKKGDVELRCNSVRRGRPIRNKMR